MQFLIVIVALIHLITALPQSSIQDFNRDSQRSPQGNQHGVTYGDPFSNRDYFPQSFSGSVNDTSFSSLPNRGQDNFNVNYRVTESTTRSTTRFGDRQDTFHYDQGRTDSPRGVHDQYPSERPAYEPQRTSYRPSVDLHPGMDHTTRRPYDKQHASSASISQSTAFYLVVFCYLLKQF